MSEKKFQFVIVAGGTEKTTVVLVQRVRVLEADTWFSFPESLQALEHHKEITELSAIKCAIKVLKARGAV